MTKFLVLKKLQSEFPSVKISGSRGSADFIRQFYSDDIGIFESCFILTLDRNYNTTGYAKISQGGVSGTVVDVKLVAKYAIENLASGVILAHNHPSGNLNRSEADDAITRKVRDGLKILDVNLVDHIILTEDSYYSYADDGEL
jgi:DNA repair protein RadC